MTDRPGLGAIYVQSLGVPPMSPWGVRAADFLHHWLQGFPRIGDESLRKTDWSSPTEIRVHLRTSLTIGMENDLLTRLVVLAHKYGVGVRLLPCTPYAISLDLYPIPQMPLATAAAIHTTE
ncbi:MAG: hypothetical protein IPH13_20445 [Planctomycetes bacterium]|nr:hypothetical protein [Planctomycetota bacterium]